MKNTMCRLWRAGFLAGLGVAAVIAAVPAEAATNNQGMSTIPLKVVNKSGHSGKLYVLVIGQLGDTWYYVSDKSGNAQAFGDSLPYKTYGLPFGTRNKFTLRIPEVINARIYMSFGQKIQLNTGATGAPGSPAGWTSTDPNYNTLFDWFEYGWAPQPAPVPPALPADATYLNGNQTEVDMMGIPMLYTFKGVDANNNKAIVKGGFSRKGARSGIFTAMKQAGLPWAHLVIDTRGGLPLREISPYNGIDSNRFHANQLDAYINSVWTKYTGSTTMTADTTGPSQSFSGVVKNNKLVFTRSTGGTVSFDKPTTEEAYRGQFTPTLSDPSDGDLKTAAGELVTMLQATFMRTTILAKGNISNCPNPKKAYYKHAPVNMYSKIIHKFAYENKAYGFGYDDVCSQSSDGQVFQPRKVILKIPPFNK